MRLALLAIVLAFAVGCFPDAYLHGSNVDAAADVDAAAADVAPPWPGSYVATIEATLTQGTDTRMATGGDMIAVTQLGARVEWMREGGCRLTWIADGASAIVDAGQQCAFPIGDGSVTQLRLEMGAASISGRVLSASLRWTLSGGGTLVEMITATRQ